MHRLIRVDMADVQKVLTAMDERMDVECDPNKRVHERFSYRDHNCVIQIYQQVLTNQLRIPIRRATCAPGGISFQHGGFVYDRTRVRAQLINPPQRPAQPLVFHAQSEANTGLLTCPRPLVAQALWLPCDRAFRDVEDTMET